MIFSPIFQTVRKLRNWWQGLWQPFQRPHQPAKKDSSGDPATPPPDSLKPPSSKSGNNRPSSSDATNNTLLESSDSDANLSSPASRTETTDSPNSDPPDEMANSGENGRSRTDPPTRLPRNIGPRRSGPRTPAATGTKRERNAVAPLKPELICRQSANAWSYEVLLLSEEVDSIAEVRHNGELLSQESDGEWHLSQFTGELNITRENGKKFALPLHKKDAPLIFKFRNNWVGNGRRIKNVTMGCSIVIAPVEWTRTGHVPSGPETCTDSRFRAHFFHRDRETNDPGGFQECSVTAEAGFKLTGDRVFDDSDQGELFVGTIPALKVIPDVASARAGEESPNGWTGENFDPAEESSLKQVLANHQGWFYLRVYDGHGTRLDSGDFRYYSDLQEIRVNGTPYTKDALIVPTASGHTPAQVEFAGTSNDLLRPELCGNHPYATVQPNGAIIVAPHPDGDRISCMLATGNSRVNVIVALPRVWWEMSGRWRDTPLEMTRETFLARARSGERFRLRFPKRLDNVQLGFDKELDRKYRPVKQEDKFEVEIPLRDFADYAQIRQPLNAKALLGARCGEVTLPLVQIAADPAPATAVADSSTHAPRTRLAPWVKRPHGGQRPGKGFSFGELRETGLDKAAATRLAIPVDRRRRSAHTVNINLLRKLANE